MERKQRYKMYKSGKNWVIAPLVFFGIALGFQAGVHNVFADETIQKPQVVNLNSSVGDQKENSTSTDDSQEDTASDKDPIQTNGEEKVANQSQSEKTVTTDAGSNQKKASFEENDGQADDQQQLKDKDQLNDETINNNDQNNRTQSDNVNDKQQNNDQAAVDSQKDSNEALRNDLNKQQPSTRNLVLKNDQPKQVKENGFWYLRDKNGHNLIGFQNIQDQNKRVYYNNRG
ncbi:KxYKxGKxW signal peptide domain-containing protein, partial [Ligilactobacillus acidipiscis]